MRGQTQFTPQGAHLVLEQFAQGFDQFQAHLFGQAAHIMMAFDRDAWPARKADAFNDIGVKRALRQKGGTFDAIGIFLEHINK